MNGPAPGSHIRRQSRPPIDREAKRNFVYFLLGADERPVYIGRSSDVKRRIQAHRNNQCHPDPTANTGSWFGLVRGVTMVGPFNWRGAIDREREEIERHQPVGNVSLTARDHRPAVASRSARAAS